MKKILYTGIMIFAAIGLISCGKKAEAVIESGEEEIIEQPQKETLEQSSAAKFTYDDLVIQNNHIKYLMSEEDVRKILGDPDSVNDKEDEKIYLYKELSLVFSKTDKGSVLTSVSTSSDKYIFSRDIKVGDKADKIYEKYYRDRDCMNNYYYTDDGSTLIGNMLYGEYTMDDLEKVKVSNKIEYGVINYNGYESAEKAESYIIEFTYFEPPYKNSVASTDDDFAQIAFDIDGNGVITTIRWYYYPEINEQ